MVDVITSNVRNESSSSINEFGNSSMKYIKSKRSNFEITVDGRLSKLYLLKNRNNLEMAVTNFGARVIEFWIPDKNGNFTDVVLGYDHINKYVSYTGERFFGSTIGRFGNRISKGEFVLDGKKYSLPVNDGVNSLHGGTKGFDMVIWDVHQASDNQLVFTYLSKDGENGYPGNLQVTMSYTLSDHNEFIITHHATTDKLTIINLTHHSFYNLLGEGNGSINDHILTINADRYTPINSTLIPTGAFESVQATPMDFREPQKIGSRLHENCDQLKFGKGYDHNWVLNRMSSNSVEFAASVHEPESGRYLEVYTTQPGLQFYGGNFLNGKMSGKTGKPYSYRSAFALETQHFPDSPNHPHFPTVSLSPGEEYFHTCIYKFGIK